MIIHKKGLKKVKYYFFIHKIIIIVVSEVKYLWLTINDNSEFVEIQKLT